VRHPRITYTPSSDVTPSKVLGAVYQRAIERYREAQAADETSKPELLREVGSGEDMKPSLDHEDACTR
jgi:hypothetical protein